MKVSKDSSSTGGRFDGETLSVRTCLLFGEFAFRTKLTARNRTNLSQFSIRNGL